MAGRHSKRGARAPAPEQDTAPGDAHRRADRERVLLAPIIRWRRSSAPAMVPVPRRPGIEVVDALTRLAHQVSPDELAAGHRRSDYQAFCGVRFLAASAPGESGPDMTTSPEEGVLRWPGPLPLNRRPSRRGKR